MEPHPFKKTGDPKRHYCVQCGKPVDAKEHQPTVPGPGEEVPATEIMPEATEPTPYQDEKITDRFDRGFGSPPPAPSMGKDLVRFIDKAMFDAEPVEQGARDLPKVYLLSATPDPLGALAATCLMYEGKVVRNLAEITDEQRRFYWEDVWNTTLQAPLEQIDLHFMVEGLTRATWDQMVRQRTANFAGESLRFAVKDSLTDGVVRPGPSIQGDESRTGIFFEALGAIEAAYNALIADGVPAEDARGLLPLNTLVRGHWKTNVRNFATEVGKRTCTQAQFEWRWVAMGLKKAMLDYSAPVALGSDGLVIWNGWQYDLIADKLFQPICYTTGRCMFKAKADRGCTIRERVERGAFEEINPGEWALDPTAAWVK